MPAADSVARSPQGRAVGTALYRWNADGSALVPLTLQGTPTALAANSAGALAVVLEVYENIDLAGTAVTTTPRNVTSVLLGFNAL